MLRCAIYPPLRHRENVLSLKICFSSSILREGKQRKRKQNTVSTLEVSGTNQSGKWRQSTTQHFLNESIWNISIYHKKCEPMNASSEPCWVVPRKMSQCAEAVAHGLISFAARSKYCCISIWPLLLISESTHLAVGMTYPKAAVYMLLNIRADGRHCMPRSELLWCC